MNYLAPAKRFFNRQHRRKLEAFGRTSAGILETGLTPFGSGLTGHPRQAVIARAIANAVAAGAAYCFCCHEIIGVAGAFLCALDPRGSAASCAVSTCCATCWRDHNDAAIEAAAVNVLQAAIQGAQFLEPARRL